jgi:cyclic-di-GMP-binding protein
MPTPISLVIPVARAEPAPELEIRPKNVKRWIDTLDPNITFESGRAMLRHLAGVNRANVDVGSRIEILDGYRPAVDRILAALEVLYVKAPLPLAPGPRSAIGLARELWTELAIAYRIAIVDVSPKLFATKKQLGGLLLKAMQATAARMYAAYKSYTPVPPGTWADLHELYLRAEELGVARDASDSEPKASVVDVYVDALLLALTDPYRLAQGEAERVLQVLRNHRGHATLGQARPQTPPGGHFIVPCNGDKPPKPSIGKLDDTGGPDWRLLDANGLIGPLARRQDEQAKKGTVPAKAEAELIGRLVKLWGDPPKRASRRDPGSNTVAISMGIDGVGHFIAQQSQMDLERQDDMLKRGITMPLAPLPMDDAEQPIPIFEWEVVNESRGGLRVRRVDPTQQPIAVGEVAGIKMHGKPYWAVGVVRWVTMFEDGGMEFGLQYLAPMARAVEVKAWGAPSGTGLLLADEEARASTLLTAPNTFSPQREFELEDDGDAVIVRAGDVVEVTHRFEIFTVKSG